jgi:hypothetical protein
MQSLVLKMRRAPNREMHNACIEFSSAVQCNFVMTTCMVVPVVIERESDLEYSYLI